MFCTQRSRQFRRISSNIHGYNHIYLHLHLHCNFFFVICCYATSNRIRSNEHGEIPYFVKIELQHVKSIGIQMIWVSACSRLFASFFWLTLLKCCKCDAFEPIQSKPSSASSSQNEYQIELFVLCWVCDSSYAWQQLLGRKDLFSPIQTPHRIFAYASKLICCFLFFFVSLPISSFHTMSYLFIHFKLFILHHPIFGCCCCCLCVCAYGCVCREFACGSVNLFWLLKIAHMVAVWRKRGVIFERTQT